MRILLISHTCQTENGQPKARALSKTPGLDLRVLVPDRWRQYRDWRRAEVAEAERDLFHVHRVHRPWLGPARNYLHGYPGLKRMLRQFRPHVIDLWEEPWSFISVQACRLRDQLLPESSVVTQTEQNIPKRLPPPFQAFRRYVLSRTDHAVGRSREALDVLRGQGYRGPASVVPNAVDTDLFQPGEGATARRDLGLDGFVLGYAGRLVREKGLFDLIEAIAPGPSDLKLLLLGEGPAKYPLRQRANELGIAERVWIRPGQPLDRMPEAINAMDVLVLPSHTTRGWKEQFGRVLIEAQACRVPVIGSDSGAIPDVIGQAGLVVPEADPPALARAVERLRTDPDFRRRLGRAGRARALQRYTWDKVAQQMARVYESLVPRPAEKVRV